MILFPPIANEPVLLGESSSPYDYAVAIENGIVRAATNATVENPSEVWVDLAVVFVRNLQTGSQAFSTSCGVQFSSEFVGEWVEDGQEGTVGNVIAASTGCDKQDPHAFLTKGAFPRSALLEQAIRVAVATLPVATEPSVNK